MFDCCRWCHDIGREQAANKPLLKTVFQVRSFCALQLDTNLYIMVLELIILDIHVNFNKNKTCLSALSCLTCSNEQKSFVFLLVFLCVGDDAVIHFSQVNFIICYP